MDYHQNARLTIHSREQLARRVLEQGCTLKLGRIARPSHRVTGNRRDRVAGIGWEYFHVAIDDHSRVAFSALYPDEKQASVLAFLAAALAYYARFGIRFRAVLTDNGPAYCSHACRRLGLKHRFTRPYTPRTNGKAERFIQTALREWAYARCYQNSNQRSQELRPWLHQYNWHRPHGSLGASPPITRSLLDRNNLLRHHTSVLSLKFVYRSGRRSRGSGRRFCARQTVWDFCCGGG